MSRMLGIHRLIVLAGVKTEEFEEYMSKELFPAAAEVSGGVTRAGQSAIKSQHLLKAEGDDKEYLWVVKDSGMFDRGFAGIFKRMYEENREKLNSFASCESSVAFVVVDGFDAGPRGVSGKTLDEPTRGGDI